MALLQSFEVVDKGGLFLKQQKCLCYLGQKLQVAYFSHKLAPTESQYSTYDRKLLAVYLFIKHFRHFVEGHTFSVYTKHKPFTLRLSLNYFISLAAATSKWTD